MSFVPSTDASNGPSFSRGDKRRYEKLIRRAKGAGHAAIYFDVLLRPMQSDLKARAGVRPGRHRGT
jgi:hypothetical protein